MNNKQIDGLITALYERLSRDDEQLGDSNSIVNQKKMLETYCEQNGYTNIVHYTDDGYSGGSFDRPDWKRLIEDIEAGKVGMVITKDMSRIGRNYLEVGYYTEIYFGQKDIHFIAIANGVDSDNQGSSEFAPFLNVMNEWYLRDCSRKIRATKQVIGNSGKHISSHAPYGYKKDPEDKHHWLVDEEAAEVVRRIYRLCIEGKGIQMIAKQLQADKIETPGYYQAKRSNGVYKNRLDVLDPYKWSGTMVKHILTKPDYLGYTVNFRTTSKSYKDKKSIQNPPEKWAVFEGTQEPIIDLETWQLCQKLLGTPRRCDTIEESNPFTGLVYCADCGEKMYNQRSRPFTDSIGTKHSGTDAYNCSTYKLSKKNKGKGCFAHHISTNSLREIVLFTVRTVSQYAIANKDDFIARVREASAVQQDNTAKELKRKLNKDKRRYEELDVLYKRLYESYAVGKISEEKFDMLSSGYEQEQKELKISISEAENAVEQFEKDSVNIDAFLSLAAKYTDFSELTKPMINEFIDKIVVHAPDRSTGERIQEVEIYLNFVGNISIPAPEPTPEELEQMEKDRYWKELYRKRRDKELARRKRIRAEEKAKKAAQFAQTQADIIESFAEDMKDNPPTLPFEVRQVPSA
ncbi:MAG: DUF4368 domain-containing protein [Clostridia bacterium]|nr:DUF4368 domain-containing protein [Clostridia bacterium]